MYGPVPLLELCMSSTPAQYAIVESKSENETTHRERGDCKSNRRRMKRNTENVTGNRPNMDRKRCSERSTDDGDLEKKDEENVIIETTMVQCLESRMQTDIIATTHLTPRFFQPIQPSWPLRRGAETRPCG